MWDGMMALTFELYYDQGICPNEKRKICTILGLWIVILSSHAVTNDAPLINKAMWKEGQANEKTLHSSVLANNAIECIGNVSLYDGTIILTLLQWEHVFE